MRVETGESLEAELKPPLKFQPTSRLARKSNSLFGVLSAILIARDARDFMAVLQALKAGSSLPVQVTAVPGESMTSGKMREAEVVEDHVPT